MMVVISPPSAPRMAQPRMWWVSASVAGIDNNQWRGELSRLAAVEMDLKRLWGEKMGLALEQIQPWRRLETALEVAARARDDALFALAHGPQIDRNGAGVDAVVSASPCQVGEACAGDHRFGGGTAHVDTGPADVVALNERHVAACLREGDGQESAAPTAPEHNRIIGCGVWHPKVLLLFLR